MRLSGGRLVARVLVAGVVAGVVADVAVVQVRAEGGSAQQSAERPAPAERTPAPGALRHAVEGRLGAFQLDGGEESRLMLEAAIEVAGEEAVPVLVEGLRRSWREPSGAAAAWGLGQALRPAPGERERNSGSRAGAVKALREALASPAVEVRRAAASALGVLEAREAESDLLDLLVARDLDAETEDVLLLALAGLKGRGLSMLEARLDRGGDELWSAGVVASFLRWGGEAWPELVLRLERSPDARVRAAAVTALVLLAEPASACAIGELQGAEPEPVLRRVMLQALAATRHPLARDQLALIGRTEAQPQLAEAARLLSEGLQREKAALLARAPARGPRHSVPELLARLERRAGHERHVEEIETRADPVHVEAIATVLRRLPLRGDSRALRDHARLAQVRARLLCLDGMDCRSAPPRRR